MRALRILAGVAVLLNALHFVHAIQHFAVHDSPHTPASLAGIAAAILIDLLSFAGGFLLLWQRG
jgi:hypothetical protein